MTSGLNGTEVLLRRDRDILQERVDKIYAGKRPNMIVVDPGYMTPKVFLGRSLPAHHPRGELSYYLEIKETIDKALESGYIHKENEPAKAPDYISDIVKEFGDFSAHPRIRL